MVERSKKQRFAGLQLEKYPSSPVRCLHIGQAELDRGGQIHRSTLVNVNAVSGVTRDFRGRQIVTVKGHPEKLEVSRSYVGLFKGM